MNVLSILTCDSRQSRPSGGRDRFCGQMFIHLLLVNLVGRHPGMAMAALLALLHPPNRALCQRRFGT